MDSLVKKFRKVKEVEHTLEKRINYLKENRHRILKNYIDNNLENIKKKFIIEAISDSKLSIKFNDIKSGIYEIESYSNFLDIQDRINRSHSIAILLKCGCDSNPYGKKLRGCDNCKEVDYINDVIDELNEKYPLIRITVYINNRLLRRYNSGEE